MTLASTTAENNALTGLLTDALYFGANTATPGTSGASEVVYASGTRAAITWGSPSGGSVANATTALSVQIPSSTTVTNFSTWGAATGTTGGGYQIGGSLGSSITYVSAGALAVAIGGLTASAS